MAEYSVSGYGSMIADRVRMAAYGQALSSAVGPDSVVLDLGTGTGIFALLACQMGARRVYAIEPGNSIELARESARANGYANRIVFIQGLSTKTVLPEQVDVVISDLRNLLPYYQQHLPTIIDARTRLLRTGGTLIPLKDTLWAAVVETPALYDGLMAVWDENPYGLDLRAPRQAVANTPIKVRLTPAELLTGSECGTTIDYLTVENTSLSTELLWEVRRPGIGHGIVAWFDSELAGDAHLTNAPGSPELIYGCQFFPWSEPVPLDAGFAVRCSLDATLIGGDYVWQWQTSVKTRPDSDSERVSFQQSTLLGTPLSREWLRKRADTFRPARNEAGEVSQFVLAQMTGTVALGEIATRVASLFPARFQTWRDAMGLVGDIADQYSR